MIAAIMARVPRKAGTGNREQETRLGSVSLPFSPFPVSRCRCKEQA
jgi:hypothetical protein